MPRERKSPTAVIFDLDGTLTKHNLDFDAIRREIGLESGPILEAMEHMGPPERARARRILEARELEAAAQASLYDDALETLGWLRKGGHPIAILTRNSRRCVDVVLGRFAIEVDAIRTRDDGAIKPSGAPVLSLCRELSADAQSSWMVGDYLFDLLSGIDAGTKTVLMLGDRSMPEYAHRADHVIRRLAELRRLVGFQDGQTSPRDVAHDARDGHR